MVHDLLVDIKIILQSFPRWQHKLLILLKETLETAYATGTDKMCVFPTGNYFLISKYLQSSAFCSPHCRKSEAKSGTLRIAYTRKKVYMHSF